VSSSVSGDRRDRRVRRGRIPGCCALIAIKERARCKSRLESELTPAARIELVRDMLGSAIAAARSASTIGQVIVVSPERDTVPSDIAVLADAGWGLNEALLQAQRALHELGCRELLVLPADLPAVTGQEIDKLVRVARRGGFALASDEGQTGTNALCLVTGQSFRFQFGVNSKQLHLLEAQRLGLRSRIVTLPGLAFDVDTPAHLHRLRKAPWLTQRQA